MTEAPLTIPISALQLSRQNEFVYDLAVRRLRELILDCQKRRGSGRLSIELHTNNGQLNRDPSVGYKWTESQ